MLPPGPTNRRPRHEHDFEADTRLQRSLSTLHERRCRHSCKTRFRLAGCASTGRGSNPLGHNERFPATSFPLSRAYPDASWAHGRRKFFVLADVARGRGGPAVAAPLAAEAVRRIDAIFAAERPLNGLAADERLAARRCAIAGQVADLEAWMRDERARLSRHAEVAKAMDSHEEGPGQADSCQIRAFGSQMSGSSRSRYAATPHQLTPNLNTAFC